MVHLSSLAAANPAHRIQKPNSTRRSIALFGLGTGGTELAAQAIAGGADASLQPLQVALADGEGVHRRPPAMPDLNSIVVVARPDDVVDGAPAIYQWAREIGVLVTAVVVSQDSSVLAIGDNVRTLRVNSDLMAMTTDDAYLATMLQWLGHTS